MLDPNVKPEEAPSSAPLDVLFIITKPRWGGAQSYVFTLAKACRVSGKEVAVAVGDETLDNDPHSLPERLKAEGLRTISLPGLTRDVYWKKEWTAFRALVALFRKEHPRVLHVNSSKAGALGALAGHLAGIPKVIFTAHGWAHRERRPFFTRLLIRAASWATIALSDTVIVVSKKDYDDAPVFFSRKKLHVIHNGIDAYEPEAKDTARRQLRALHPGLPETGIWLLTAAEHHANKGVDTAIDAFSEVAATRAELSLLIIGSGEDTEKLKIHAERVLGGERVFFLGFIQGARAYFKAADLFLLPSRKEGLPFALLEAGRAELPVIASRTGGIPEIIEHKETGLLVPSNNPHALARAMRTLLEDPAQAQAYGTALFERVRDRFSEVKMIEETLALYLPAATP